MDRGRIAGDGANVASEVTREIAERDPDSIMGGDVGGEFVGGVGAGSARTRDRPRSCAQI
jgi:hypothetical protein